MQFEYFMPTKIHFGCGISKKLPEILAEMPGRNILLVTGKNIRTKTTIVSQIIRLLKSYRIKIFSDVETNPDIYQVKRCIKEIVSFKAHCVIGIGGGSVLDLAKAAALLSSNKGHVEDYFLSGKRVKHYGLPVVALPTTAGTSSEITPYSVITFPEKQTKITLNSERLYPRHALVDPTLCMSAPSHIIASSGLDILSHALEAFWNIRSTPITDTSAAEAIRLVFEHLEKACRGTRETRLKALEQLCMAALFAGFAFSHTKTIAPHAVSYPLTTLFGIPHGLACSLSLPEFFLFNARVVKSKMYLLVRAIKTDKPSKIARKIKNLIRNIGCKTNLREYGIKRSDLPIILKHAYLPEKFKNNPRPVTRQNLKKIIENIF